MEALDPAAVNGGGQPLSPLLYFNAKSGAGFPNGLSNFFLVILVQRRRLRRMDRERVS